MNSKSTPHSEEPGELVAYDGRGARLAIQELYRLDYRARWADLDRNRLTIDDVDSNTSDCAIVARYETGTSPTDLYSITVHSPYIISFLAQVFAGYPGVYTSLKHVDFVRPFDQFYHRWQNFLDIAEQETNVRAQSHIKLLQDLIGEIIRPIKVEVDDLLANGLMDFKHLWVLFPPTTEISVHRNGYDQLFQVVTTSHLSGIQYTLDCDYIDCNGKDFGYTERKIPINHFNGLKSIQDLDHTPLSMHQDKQLRQRSSARGRKFEKLNGVYYRSFSGVAKVNLNNDGYHDVPLRNARIIIDPTYFRVMQVTLNTMYDIHYSTLHNRPRVETLSQAFFDESQDTSSHHQKRMPMRGRKTSTDELDDPLKEPMTTLNEDQYALCTPVVKGFSMVHKAWASFPVDGISEIEWNDNALERLVLHDDYKQIILAFVEAQLTKKDNFDDVIQGKGRGVIMLFQGPAGVGKTLTAESVAEEMKCPLYALSSGELGDTAPDVERNLQMILQHCTRWKAVLLLDECDVFLERRSRASMRQNKLVAIFLRLLEYYQGCLMLTTNRVDGIDPAFESRIHLTIKYPGLNADSRYHIWRNFLHDLGHAQSSHSTKSAISEDDVKILATQNLNGRQIKNAIKTGRLLAAREKVALNFEHIRTVLRANGTYRDDVP